MNKVVLIGYVARDPAYSKTSSGISKLEFCIAVKRKYKNSNGEYEADFLSVITWRSVADYCSQYLHKGDMCAVAGALQTRNYEDKNGIKRYVTEVVAEDVQVTNSADKTPSAPKETPKTAKQTSFADLEPVDDDELPF